MKERYQRVRQLSAEHSVQMLCGVLGVSRSGYYAWSRRAPCRRQQEDAQLLQVLVQLHAASRRTYGQPRLRQALRQQGHHCSAKRVGRLMKAAGLYGRRRKRFCPRTTQRDTASPIAANRLATLAAVEARDQVWVTDLTYIRTQEGWLYLSVLLDLYSRRVVGWAFAEHLESSLPLGALAMALAHRRPGPGLLHHSDRGCQYTSAEYRAVLSAHGLESSMSAAGHCYDNAAMESFWSTLKVELIYRQEWQTRAQVRLAVFDYIETFYNRERLHSALGYKTPVDFETKNN